MSSYHGWTHAPKEDGGTDPIPFPETTAASAVPIEWVYYESTTDWGAGPGLITLEFSETGGNYDHTLPTFGISAGNDPQIERDGHYQMQLGIFNYAAVPGVEKLIRAEVKRLSGPIPGSWRSPAGPLANLGVGEWSTDINVPWPFTSDFWDYEPGSFSGTPSVWQVKVWELDDGVQVADTDIVVRMSIQRLGDSFA